MSAHVLHEPKSELGFTPAMTFAEIGEELHIHEATARSICRDALKKLRRLNPDALKRLRELVEAREQVREGLRQTL